MSERGCIARIDAMPEMTRALVAAVKAADDKRGRPQRLFASFCPFCGVRYPTREAAP